MALHAVLSSACLEATVDPAPCVCLRGLCRQRCLLNPTKPSRLGSVQEAFRFQQHTLLNQRSSKEQDAALVAIHTTCWAAAAQEQRGQLQQQLQAAPCPLLWIICQASGFGEGIGRCESWLWISGCGSSSSGPWHARPPRSTPAAATRKDSSHSNSILVVVQLCISLVLLHDQAPICKRGARGRQHSLRCGAMRVCAGVCIPTRSPAGIQPDSHPLSPPASGHVHGDC